MQVENEKKLELFSDRLRGLRGSKGLTQSELAAEMGVSLGAVGNWESRQNIPTGPTLRKLSDFFSVSMSYLVGETENPTRHPSEANGGRGPAGLREGASYYNAAQGEAVDGFTEDPEAFMVEMFGDAMEPKIVPMDRLVVSPNAKLESGDLVMAKKTDDEIMVRMYIAGAQEGSLRLVAYNAIYGEQEWKRAMFKFIYPIVGVWRRTKVRGLYQPAAAAPKESDGK